MALGYIKKDKVWREVLIPKDIVFENFEYLGLSFGWNEDLSLLLINQFNILIKTNKDEFLLAIQNVPEFLNAQLQRLNIDKEKIELWGTYYEQA